jgi:hypothetical protein
MSYGGKVDSEERADVYRRQNGKQTDRQRRRLKKKAKRDSEMIRAALSVTCDGKGMTIDKAVADELPPLHMSPKWSD